MKKTQLTIKEQHIYQALRQTMEKYAPLSEQTWQAFTTITRIKKFAKASALVRLGEIPTSYHYIYQGLVRGFTCNDKGVQYNKKFFSEGMFPGAMTALLTNSPSILALETIEETELVEINFNGFRHLLLEKDDLKLFQIHYLEQNWLLDKDQREIEIVQQDATMRYRQFLQQHPELIERIPQYHIASHLGITPTQLSRIRKNFPIDQPM
ncbi:Crp/Fnr family transcriptional regulator [Thalassotalea sp. G2M2-11]|uniref:Crp/Fnr family transcriptional regulator n=1 Tax=Thalassotalea sp. G2M2-11 TaxID=2787627 RepID=UPI0019D11A9A|nr:Crp/Fnr family transcriptional regulator [Thalassotalea sp. G2M2-11]